MTNCRAVNTPLPPCRWVSDDDSPQFDAERAEMKEISHRNAIGSLMYLATCTRPNISTRANNLARYSADPRTAHWEGVLHELKYLQEKIDTGISYK